MAHKRSWKTNPDAVIEVKLRSGYICEHCGVNIAVHIHHLTYERAGHELPQDLEHRCLECHISAHPEKREELFGFEISRLKKFRPGREREQETAEERREREHEMEGPDEPAWNLGRYEANGYDHAAVRLEEKYRRLYD